MLNLNKRCWRTPPVLAFNFYLKTMAEELPKHIQSAEELGYDPGVIKPEDFNKKGLAEKLVEIEEWKDIEPQERARRGESAVAGSPEALRGPSRASVAPERVETPTNLEIARREFIDVWSQDQQAGKASGKLAKLKGFFSLGEKRVQKKEEIAAATLEKGQAEESLAVKQKDWAKAFKEKQKNLLEGKKQELVGSGKTQEEIDKLVNEYAKELVAEAAKEAALVDGLKSDKQIEEMGAWRKGLNEKVGNFMDWYKKLPLKGRMAVSAGLLTVGAAGALAGGVPGAMVMSAAFAGQAGLRVLGGALTAGGLEQLMKGAQQRSAEKRIVKEFGDKSSEALEEDSKLEEKMVGLAQAKKGDKAKRFILAGTAGALVGSGALGYAIRNVADWIKGPSMGTPVASSEQPGIAKAAAEKLPIGERGPGGAIIDYFKANPEAAKKFGWDGQADINKWSGAKAHNLWLEHSGQALKNPETLAELKKLGYSANAEGYAKMMHRIGEGFVELNPKSGMNLADMDYLKAYFGDADKVIEEVKKSGEITGDALKKLVTENVKPELFKDGDYLALKDKVSLETLLKDFPESVTDNKYGLANKWHGFGGQEAFSGDRYGNMTYNGAQKLSALAKFARQLVDKKLVPSEDMAKTVGQFFEKYGK